MQQAPEGRVIIPGIAGGKAARDASVFDCRVQIKMPALLMLFREARISLENLFRGRGLP
jgi:hypothetical protein